MLEGLFWSQNLKRTKKKEKKGFPKKCTLLHPPIFFSNFCFCPTAKWITSLDFLQNISRKVYKEGLCSILNSSKVTDVFVPSNVPKYEFFRQCRDFRIYQVAYTKKLSYFGK